MGYVPFFLTLGGFVLLFVMVVNSTFKSKKNRLNQLSLEALEVMGKLEKQQLNKKTNESSLVDEAIKKFQKDKDMLAKANPSVFENELIPKMKALKLSKASYNQLVGEKPYSFIAKIMGHQPLS